METSGIKKITVDVAGLAMLNQLNQNYFGYPANVQSEKIAKDFELLKEFTKAYHSRYGNEPSLGDCLLLPDRQIVYFCHVHDDSVQTCGGGSFHLSPNGCISYSGGLDSGISIREIELTKEKQVLTVWFSHRGYLCAGCSIYANIECRVWRTKDQADLSGIPQVERLRKRKLKEQSETVRKIDGNGVEYFEHLPEIIIWRDNVSEETLKQIEQSTGLTFEVSYRYVSVYWCQPMTLKQVEDIRKFTQFHFTEERDFNTQEPILILQMG